MIQRCNNPKNPKYADYGGRGITVCERWQKSYLVFAADVGLRPSLKHSIDRINNDGNYEQGNVQWATPIMQSMNRRIRKTNSSGVTGVYWHEGFQKWHATITINKRRHHLGLFKTLPEAAEARYLAEARYTV